MGEVKRYELEYVGRPYMQSREMREHQDGDWVDYDDHLREVTRLQRARARALVRRMRKEADRLTDCELFNAANWAYAQHLHARADRIAAKYLKEGT